MDWYSPALIAHTECLIRSLAHWTGRDLTPGVSDPRERARLLFEAPFVLVSHGTEADPILNYGDRSALTLWDTTWDELILMPSRLTAEAPNREERARLLERVTRDGFIAEAAVWNLLTPAGHPCGQAAMFTTWTFLD